MEDKFGEIPKKVEKYRGRKKEEKKVRGLIEGI